MLDELKDAIAKAGMATVVVAASGFVMHWILSHLAELSLWLERGR